MRALRVVVEGLTTSFRYPHFLMGRQPTYRMPPPATIYGHICSAVGDWIDAAALEFAYEFRYDSRGDDLELLHIASVKQGRWPGGGDLLQNLDVTTNPSAREVLFSPKMTLYLRSHEERLLAELLGAFRQPRYAVTLGRSQDLMAYRRVELVDLPEADDVYVRDTLLPWSYRTTVSTGVGVTMPRFIDPADRRRVTWSPYVVLQGGSILHRDEAGLDTGLPDTWTVDPEAPHAWGRRRAVVWHTFLPKNAGERIFVESSDPPLG